MRTQMSKMNGEEGIVAFDAYIFLVLLFAFSPRLTIFDSETLFFRCQLSLNSNLFKPTGKNFLQVVRDHIVPRSGSWRVCNPRASVLDMATRFRWWGNSAVFHLGKRFVPPIPRLLRVFLCWARRSYYELFGNGLSCNSLLFTHLFCAASIKFHMFCFTQVILSRK